MNLDQVHAITTQILLQHGMSQAQAAAIATTVTGAERDGCTSHGLYQVPNYVASVKRGRVNCSAEPTLGDLAPGVIQVDGQGGFSPLAVETGRAPLAELARRQGIAALSIINAHHFAGLWPEVELLAEQGLVAFAYLNSSSYVAPAGGTKPLYGTNPIAFAWPRDGRPPLVFDQATSASSRGEIMHHQREGKPIPEGWAIGPNGRSTTDPETALAGAQLPFGGYKGAALSLMVELIAGALVGGAFGFEASSLDAHGRPRAGGELIVAIEPGCCVANDLRAGQLARAEELFAQVLAQEGTRLPSDRRYAARAHSIVEGVRIPALLYETLQKLQKS